MRDFEPREYQQIALRHLLDVPRCALYAGMGMGKTSSSLLALDTLSMSSSHPSLVLAPLRVARDVWPNEARKWKQFSHLRISPIVGTEKEREAALKRDVPIFTTNYENLEWLVERFGHKWPFRQVVADESTKLKSFRLRQGGKRAAALGKIAHKKIERFIQLTGTPSPNGLADLWGQIWFLDEGERLGRTFSGFTQRWFRALPGKGDFQQLRAMPHAQDEIQERLRDICLTLDPKDWFDLREPIHNVVRVELPAKARKIYADMEKQMFAELEEEGATLEAFGAAARTIKCLQLANGAAYTDAQAGKYVEVHDAKLDALSSIVEESGGMPILVAYHFKPDLARLQRAFPRGVNIATQEGMAAFKAGRAPLGFGHPASIGHGVDGLQDVTNQCVFFGHWWNMEERMQFIERIGPVRQMQSGHNRAVTIHDIVSTDTVDELVLERHASKRDVQAILLDAMKQRKRMR